LRELELFLLFCFATCLEAEKQQRPSSASVFDQALYKRAPGTWRDNWAVIFATQTAPCVRRCEHGNGRTRSLLVQRVSNNRNYPLDQVYSVVSLYTNTFSKHSPIARSEHYDARRRHSGILSGVVLLLRMLLYLTADTCGTPCLCL